MDGAFAAASAALILVFISAGAPIPLMASYRAAGVDNAGFAYASVAYFFAAAAGLLGPLMDMADGVVEGAGYPLLFITCSLAFLASAVALNGVRGAQRSAPMLPVEQSIP